MRPSPPERLPVPVAEQGTRLLARTHPWSAEAVALLGCALRKEAVLELLQGLAEEPRKAALGLAQHLLGLDPGTRKARLAQRFGERLDGGARVRELLVGNAGLEAELWRRLPAHHQRSHPQLQGTSPQAPHPVRDALVERLVKEALR